MMQVCARDDTVLRAASSPYRLCAFIVSNIFTSLYTVFHRAGAEARLGGSNGWFVNPSSRSALCDDLDTTLFVVRFERTVKYTVQEIRT